MMNIHVNIMTMGMKIIQNIREVKIPKKRPGFNYRMTEMQAAVGKVQLKKLDQMLIENKKRYCILNNKLINNFQLRDIRSTQYQIMIHLYFLKRMRIKDSKL